MKSEALAFVLAAAFGIVALVYASLGIARLAEGIFGIIFLAIGTYAGYLALRILARRRLLWSDIGGYVEKSRYQLMGAALLGLIGWFLRRSALGWFFFWPLWGTDTLVFMAAVFAENELGLPYIEILLKGFALAFEGMYLVFLSGLALRASAFLRRYR